MAFLTWEWDCWVCKFIISENSRDEMPCRPRPAPLALLSCVIPVQQTQSSQGDPPARPADALVQLDRHRAWVYAHHQAASPLNPEAEARALDMTQAECDALVSYVRSLPAPGSVTDVSSDVENGRRLFQSIGCAGCHTPDLGSIGGIYSDLLLHDMGQQLKDAGAYYEEVDQSDSSSSTRLTEWRTPPLWGFPDSGPYLHDGRA